MNDNEDQSLISLPVSLLANTAAAASRVLSEMIGEMLSIAKEVVVANADLDALVREGKRLYHHAGERMTEDNIQAFKLFFRAAGAGHSEAQYHLFRCYNWGCGIQENATEAERWLRKAAENGFPKALLFLGIAYNSEAVCPTLAKDEDEAINWFQKAAGKGYSIACMQISGIYKKRNDDTEELRWMKEAALRGCTDSLWEVKRFYEQQQLTRIDLAEAYAWLLLFADYSPHSDTKAEEMEAAMSPPELGRASQLHRAYTVTRGEWARQAPELCYFR